MGLTPRIWSHLAGVWQEGALKSVSPSTSPDVGSLISTITAVPDRARAARAGGEYSKNLHRRAPPAPPRPAAPRRAPVVSQMSGFARSRSLVSFLNCARSADRRVGLPGSGLGIESSGSNALQSGLTKYGAKRNKMMGQCTGTLNPSISHGPEGGRLRAPQAYESRNYRHCHQALRYSHSYAAQGRWSDSLEGVE